VRLAGGDDPVEQLALVLRRDPQLVAEVAGVVDPGQVDRRHPEVDPRNVMNGNASVDRSRSRATALRTSRERGPATDNPTSPSPSTSNRIDPSRGRWCRNQREWWTSAGSDPKR
jgi:hypothetical protein